MASLPPSPSRRPSRPSRPRIVPLSAALAVATSGVAPGRVNLEPSALPTYSVAAGGPSALPTYSIAGGGPSAVPIYSGLDSEPSTFSSSTFAAGGSSALPVNLDPVVDHVAASASIPPSSCSNVEYSLNGSFTSLMTQNFGEDDFGNQSNYELGIDLSQSSPVPPMCSQYKTKGRTKNFSEEEDILLVSAYLNISTDAVQGNQQKDGRFWIRVEKYFHEHRKFDSDRNSSSLKHRWQALQKDVNAFQGCYDSIERKNESGKTINDKLADAKAMFHQLTKKSFSAFHAWNILHLEPKWTASRASKCSNSNTKKNNILESKTINVDHEVEPNVERPAGRKVEKERLRRLRKRGDDDFDPFIDEVKKFREVRQMIEKERKERDDIIYEFEKKRFQLEQDQHDTKIMETDTSTMDDETKKYFKKMKEEILARRFGNSQP